MARTASNSPNEGNACAGLHDLRLGKAREPAVGRFGSDEQRAALLVMLEVLQARPDSIREHWRLLLERTSPTSALGEATILVFHFDRTLSAVFRPNATLRRRRHLPIVIPRHPENPWMHYFVTLEQTLLHTIDTSQIEWPKLSCVARAVATDEVQQRVRRIARQEVGLFDKLLIERQSAIGADNPPGPDGPQK